MIRSLPIPVILGLLFVALILFTLLINHRNASDRARADVEFLAQCHAAGYDAAKCRFWGPGSNGTEIRLKLEQFEIADLRARFNGERPMVAKTHHDRGIRDFDFPNWFSGLK